MYMSAYNIVKRRLELNQNTQQMGKILQDQCLTKLVFFHVNPTTIIKDYPNTPLPVNRIISVFF